MWRRLTLWSWNYGNKLPRLGLASYLTLNIFSASARAPTASLREKMMLMDLASFEAISDDCKQINQVKIKNQTVANCKLVQSSSNTWGSYKLTLSELEIFRQAVRNSKETLTEKVSQKIFKSDLRKYLITNINITTHIYSIQVFCGAGLMVGLVLAWMSSRRRGEVEGGEWQFWKTTKIH